MIIDSDNCKNFQTLKSPCLPQKCLFYTLPICQKKKKKKRRRKLAFQILINVWPEKMCTPI